MSHLDIFGLLRGELSNNAAIAAGDHLADCAACREELVEATIAHALLTRAGATLGSSLVEPPTPPPLAVPAPARGRRTIALVAAAAVIVAAVGGATWWRATDDPSSGPDAEIEAALTPLSGAGGDGRVRMVEHDGRTQMTFVVQELPSTTGNDYYYAWLLDPATNKMLPLGQVDPRNGATFDLDDGLVSSYSAVDVSLESDDGDAGHSVTSVLRGTYQPAEITPTEGNHA